MKRFTASALAVSALALGLVTAVLAGGKPQIKFTAADQTAARAVVLRRSDLGSSGWQGGARKPDLSSTVSCAGFHPKVSDLVVTGAAETDFQRSGVELSSVVEVLKTRRMVRLDWRRSLLPAAVVPCLRKTLAAGLPAGAKVVSFGRAPFPQVGTRSARFRGVIRVDVFGRTTRLVADFVFVNRSRTEITLNAVGPVAAKGALADAEVRLARVMVTRARA
jgi:hypothetical protein